MNKLAAVKHILRNTNHGAFVNDAGGKAFAPSNIALCKYWGKRNTELNLPLTSSLSLSLGNKGSTTIIKQEGSQDSYSINEKLIALNSNFGNRLKNFLDLFRIKGANFAVDIKMNLPVAAGLASSACGFAALVLALNNLYYWNLSKPELSILARLGSGSACRSLWEGFVLWQVGEKTNGMDSHGVPLPFIWPEIRLGSLILSNKEKTISSREAMQKTQATSPLFKVWPEQVERDLKNLLLALKTKDFFLLGKTAEQNAQIMHEITSHANPSIIFADPKTLIAKQQVWELRKNNIPVFFTQDAGPNLQLLFLAEVEEIVLQTFPEIEIITPFSSLGSQQLILVDENDTEIGTGEKLAVHLQGKLHRAFSVFIFRMLDGELELLLQQRSAKKYHSANLWSNTCCGHPKPGENILAAAQNRLIEEMGIAADLKIIGSFHYESRIKGSDLYENELDYCLIGATNQTKFEPNLEEVQNFRWINIKELLIDLKQNPSHYTVWLEPAIKIAISSQKSDAMKF